jgi:hypothetical protein
LTVGRDLTLVDAVPIRVASPNALFATCAAKERTDLIVGINMAR